MHKLFTILIIVILSSFVFAQDKQYVDLGAKVIQVAEKSILAVSFKNEKDWHTYWKNPGDAGLSIKLKFETEEKEIQLKDYPWPAPKRYIEQGNMWAYGYGGKYAHYFDLPETLKNKSLTIIGEWLVCKDICIPGTRTVKLSIDQALNGENNSLISDAELVKDFKSLPKETTETKVKFFLTKSEKSNQLALQYMIENVDFEKISKRKILLPLIMPSHLIINMKKFILIEKIKWPMEECI